MKTAKTLGLAGIAVIAAASMAATTFAPSSAAIKHPHISKTVTAELGENKLTLSYFTAPANMEHVEKVKEGDMAMGFGSLECSEDLEIGESKIPAGKYSIGAIKEGEDSWTLALYPGRPGRGEAADVEKAILLESMNSTDMGDTGHVSFDIMPGHGDLEGKATLVWHFGNMYLAGAIS